MSENFIDFGLKTAEKQFIARNMGEGKHITSLYSTEYGRDKYFSENRSKFKFNYNLLVKP